ncbi:MAG: hypothetical protein V3U84_10760 [Thiotrichaceae bacterium]
MELPKNIKQKIDVRVNENRQERKKRLQEKIDNLNDRDNRGIAKLAVERNAEIEDFVDSCVGFIEGIADTFIPIELISDDS